MNSDHLAESVCSDNLSPSVHQCLDGRRLEASAWGNPPTEQMGGLLADRQEKKPKEKWWAQLEWHSRQQETLPLNQIIQN